MSNPDRLLLERCLREGGRPRPFDSNPFAAALGGSIVAVDAARGVLTLEFHPGPEFVQGNGVVQGGAISAMLDFALGLCPLARLPPDMTIATASLNVSFLRAARPGRLRVVGEVDKLGKRTAFARAALADARGETIATGTSVLSIIPDRAGG